MTHPYARRDPNELRPEEGPNPVEIRYGPGGLRRDLLLGSVMTLGWIPVYLGRDMAWPFFLALGLLWVIMATAWIRRERQFRVDPSPLLTLSDEGLRHWAADGSRLTAFRWTDLASIELESTLLEGPVLAVRVRDSARSRVSPAPFGSGHMVGVVADYVIPLKSVELDPDEVVELIERYMERFGLSEFRAARAELEGPRPADDG